MCVRAENRSFGIEYVCKYIEGEGKRRRRIHERSTEIEIVRDERCKQIEERSKEKQNVLSTTKQCSQQLQTFRREETMVGGLNSE